MVATRFSPDPRDAKQYPVPIVRTLFRASSETLDFSLARLSHNRAETRILPLPFQKLSGALLYTWVKQNQLRYRKQSTSPYRLIIWADEADIQRLRQRKQVPYHDRMRQQWLAHENNSNLANDCSPLLLSGE